MLAYYYSYTLQSRSDGNSAAIDSDCRVTKPEPLSQRLADHERISSSDRIAKRDHGVIDSDAPEGCRKGEDACNLGELIIGPVSPPVTGGSDGEG